MNDRESEIKRGIGLGKEKECIRIREHTTDVSESVNASSRVEETYAYRGKGLESM